MGGLAEMIEWLEWLIAFYGALTAAFVFALSAVALAVWRLAKTMKTTSRRHYEPINDKEAGIILKALEWTKTMWITQADSDREMADKLAQRLLNFRIRIRSIKEVSHE